MAIRVTLDRILLDRRMSLTDLSEKVGVTLANLSILKTGKAKAIRFSTLNALCRVLDCQPGELLSYEASDSDAELEKADAD
jgi:putative transcriptional regulator